jgi:hypothetical protein
VFVLIHVVSAAKLAFAWAATIEVPATNVLGTETGVGMVFLRNG